MAHDLAGRLDTAATRGGLLASLRLTGLPLMRDLVGRHDALADVGRRLAFHRHAAMR